MAVLEKDVSPIEELSAAPMLMPEPEPVEECDDVKVIRKLAEEVYMSLGAGHTESVYHNAMKIGIQDLALKFETERDILIKFRERYVGTVRADLVIEQRLVVELKASNGTDTNVNDAEEQCRIYMRETGISLGAVVVFPKKVRGDLQVRQIMA
jgi:GxxExxY protein